MVSRTIDLTLPITVPGQPKPNFMLGPNAIAVDPAHAVAYVALYNANAIAVVDLSGGPLNPVMGFIPVAYAPSSVVLDAANNQLIVANDKGIGTRLSFETDYGVSGYNSHQDSGTVSIVPVPTPTTLATYTTKVYQNNHWDLKANIDSAGGGNPKATPVAMPAKIGDPSLIKHVFMIIRENRTYDQILGDVAGGRRRPLAGGVRSLHAERAQLDNSLPAPRQLLHPEPAVGRRAPVDRRGDGALRGRHPVAGLGAQLSRRQRRRFAGLPEEGLPVPGGGGRRPFFEDLRRICRERLLVARRGTELVPILRRRAEFRGRQRKRRSCTRTPS